MAKERVPWVNFLVAEDAPDLGDVTSRRSSLLPHGVSSASAPADSSSLKTSLAEGRFWISAPASTSACLYQEESLRGQPLCLFSLTISSAPFKKHCPWGHERDLQQGCTAQRWNLEEQRSG